MSPMSEGGSANVTYNDKIVYITSTFICIYYRDNASSVSQRLIDVPVYITTRKCIRPVSPAHHGEVEVGL